jgi:hypothetical protein
VVAFVLAVSTSTLSEWNKGFDDGMRPLVVPDDRGKTSKVTVEIVSTIIEKAQCLIEQGKRIRVKRFTKDLKKKNDIILSSKTVKEILIANDIMAAQSRTRRPKFYKSLCKRIQNGLLSLDGSEFTVLLDDEVYKFNVELSVDVSSFAHTAFSISDTETALEVIKVLNAHRKGWGKPVGVLCDSGTANLSEDVQRYIKAQGIELVPVGPANPKGNGTDEGAFSQMKKAIGAILIDMSSPKALAKSVLDALVSVYIYMRNRIPLHGRNVQPLEQMVMPVSEKKRDFERQQLKAHKKAKAGNNEDQQKIDRIHWVISNYGLILEPVALKRAEYTIKAYEFETIAETERAFLKAISRKKDRCNLPYFFGILRNKQQQRDDYTKRNYCRKRYNYEMMLKIQRQQETFCKQKPATIEQIIGMIEHAVTKKTRFIVNLSIRRAREWTQDLLKSYRYVGSLKKKLLTVLYELKNLSLEQLQKGSDLIEEFLTP